MTLTHHISDEILLSYAAGALPEAFGVVVASHISLCDDCRARMTGFDALGGAILERETGQPVTDTQLGEMLTLIAHLPQDSAAARPSTRSATPKKLSQGQLPAPLCDYVGERLDSLPWRAVGGGVRQYVLATKGAARARMLYIPAGTKIPDHGHGGMELTLVLQGSYHDADDSFGPGDIDIAGADTQHTPVAAENMPCICLTATDAPLRFRGLLPRVVQSFLRI